METILGLTSYPPVCLGVLKNFMFCSLAGDLLEESVDKESFFLVLCQSKQVTNSQVPYHRLIMLDVANYAFSRSQCVRVSEFS